VIPVEVGAVCEAVIEGRGRVYVQLTHRHAEYGELIRVLEGVHADRPADLAALVRAPDVWLGFYPLDAAVEQGRMTVIGDAPVPPERAGFPLFKTGVPDRDTGQVALWWLWDGEREWRADVSPEELERLPVRGIVNHAYLLGELFGHPSSGRDP